MDQISNLLAQTLNPNGDIRKSAEKQLHGLERQPGFSMALLQLLENHNADRGMKTSASLYFKNIVKKYWDEDEGASQVISRQDRDQIKAHVLTLMCNVSPVVQRQLSEAVRIIGVTDFPGKWGALLPDLTSKLGSTQDFNVILGLLETANTLFKIFREAEATDDLWSKLKYCLENFAEPLLTLFKSCNVMVEQNAGNGPLLIQLFAALRLLGRIFYSLCWQELPEYFEDHLAEWMGEFHKLMVYSNPILVDSSDEEKSGPIELVQTAIVENVKLFLAKYEEEFTPFVPTFTQDAWNLLNKTPLMAKYDDLVVIAIKFLAMLVGNVRQIHLFQTAGALKDICEKIVIPNLRMREYDFESFEDNPMEYIRRDIEGSDSDTRRRMSCDMVRKMCKNFEAETTQLCSVIMDSLLSTYSSNPSGNWHAMDTAITLMIALAVKGQTVKDGVSEINEKVQLEVFFQKFILPGLSGTNIDSQPVVKSDTIKFFTTFRNQMPRDMVIKILPSLVNLLKARSFVVHTYAAQCIERLFMIKDGNVYRYTPQDMNAILEPMMVNLFAILESCEGGVENEYVVKALMRVLSKAEPAKIAEIIGPVVGKLNGILQRVCANPQNPTFIHYLFESIAALIRSGCTVNPMLAEQFEVQLMPPFQMVLAQDIAELTPYVFQILAQMLELRPGGASPGYLSLFPPLLRPDVWDNSGNVPALVRLLEAYMRCAAQETVGADPKQLEGLLGVFQKLLSAKSTCDMSMRLLIGIVEFLRPELYAQYLQTVFQLVFARLQQLKSKHFGTSVILFLSVLVGKHGPGPVSQAMNQITPGLFIQILNELWTSSIDSIRTTMDRKASAVAMARILCEDPNLLQQPQAWENFFVAVMHLFEVPPSASDLLPPEEVLAQMTETGYSSTFSKLAYAQTEVRDSFKEIPSAKQHFVKVLFAANQQNGGVFMKLIQTALANKPNYTAHFGQYCQSAGVNF